MESPDKTLNYLMRQCSMREYCRKDVFDKALRRLESEDEAQKVVDRLVQDGFVDESRYSIAFARDKSALGGWGPMKIRTALSAKGIPRDVIAAALQEIDCGKSEEKLRKAISIKYNSLKEDPAIRIKLLKFALSRGFDYETSEKVVSEILHGK